MKVLVTDNNQALIERLRDYGHECVVMPDCTYDELLQSVKEYDALVVRSKINIDSHFIDNALNLRCIGRIGAGMETIDVDYAESRGICCLNSPEGNRDAVGEHAVGLLLALADKIASADREVRQGLWRREANRGFEIKGRTVGIIGCGNMGTAFAKRLQGFECQIIAYDKYKSAGYAPSFVEEVSLDELKSRADILSLHVPLTDETHYMVDEEFIASFAHPFYLVNTARGAVVKTSALADAMRQGKVLGAALDVIEYEDMSKDGLDLKTLPPDFRYLLDSPCTVMTPHVAGWTVESRQKLGTVLAEKINTHLHSVNRKQKC